MPVCLGRWAGVSNWCVCIRVSDVLVLRVFRWSCGVWKHDSERLQDETEELV